MPHGRGGQARATYDAHVGYGFLVLRRSGTLPPLAVVLRGRQIHKLDGVDHRRLGFGVVRNVLRVGVYIILQTVQAGKHLEHQLSASQARRVGDMHAHHRRGRAWVRRILGIIAQVGDACVLQWGITVVPRMRHIHVLHGK